MSRSFLHSVTPQSSSASQEYSSEERRLLLRVAHRSILATFHEQAKSEESYSAHLEELRGVFTTLHLGGNLRGCVGYALPVLPLHRAVAETAKAAAFEDSRFPPITEAEASQLEISLSILSPLSAVQPQDVQVGRHGLVASFGPYRGLLLPQVPVESGWDRVTFLEQTCRKAGLPLHAWHKGVKFEAFTAEVFGDADLGS